MKVNRVILIVLVLLLITQSLSEAVPHLKHQEITKGKDREEKRSSNGSSGRGGGRQSRSGGRSSRGPSNCDPLFQYLFGTCGQWPFPTSPSPNNPFQSSPRPSPPRRRAPPSTPLVPSTPPLPLHPLHHHQYLDEFTPPPPLIPILSPPSTDQPNFPPDEFAQPPPLPSFNPPPLVPMFSPPVPDDQPPQFPLLPPKEPSTFTPPIESTTPNAPDLYFPPPLVPEIPDNPQEPLPFSNYVPPAPDAA
ncbi:hypothetical protein NC652_009560 [Populus alba x Populus x berolinensis]|nr:hypothetical protein NC652_009560 [Populus alba x Populus x berolinensis]